MLADQIPLNSAPKKRRTFLPHPKKEKYNEKGCGNDLSYALSSMQGWRTKMEDAHCAKIGLPQGLNDWSFFGIFDGHGGKLISHYCAANLLDTIMLSKYFHNDSDDTDSKNCIVPPKINIVGLKSGIRSGFLMIDQRMKEIHSKNSSKVGSTAVCTFISPTHFFFANCGDSRGVLYRDKKAFFATNDHKPRNPAEKKRIENAGGHVYTTRINGHLAVSRSLGDYGYKQVEGKGPLQQLVSPEPEVDVFERDNELDEFLILACDGIWDVMSNSIIYENVRYLLQITGDLEYICNRIIDACLVKGSQDNMSVLLITLPGAPKVSEECVQQDQDLNTLLENRVKDIVSSFDSWMPKQLELSTVMSSLDEDPKVRDAFTRLPAGSYFFKYGFVEKVYNEVMKSHEAELSKIKCLRQ